MSRPVIVAAVEGPTDEAVAARLIEHAGGRMRGAYGKKGKDHLRQKIAGYNAAAHHAPWLVLVDLDHAEDCAPALCAAWLTKPAPYLCFRVAVHEVEAWLLADCDTLAGYLGVPVKHMPTHPERLPDPKGDLVALARHSRRKDIRTDMVPRAGSGRRVGPAYAGRIIDYATTAWRPDIAARSAESLRRALSCLQRLVAVGTEVHPR